MLTMTAVLNSHPEVWHITARKVSSSKDCGTKCTIPQYGIRSRSVPNALHGTENNYLWDDSNKENTDMVCDVDG